MEERKENKMGVLPVGRLLLNMSLPIMASMLIQAMYNIVDSIFVAQISENALTAVSLAFPVQNLMISVAVGTGVGINAVLSRRLGEKQFEEANAVAMNGFFLGVCSWAVFTAFGILFSERFFRLFTENPEIVSLGADYLWVVTVFSFGHALMLVNERLMQATGNTVYSMFIQGSGAILNIILDPIFIFGLFGVPAMGVKGAAIATVAGQIVGMLLGIYLNITRNREITLRFRGFRPNGRVIADIYRIGIPSIIMQSITSVMIVGLNKILISFTETAAAVLGVYFKLQSFIFMPIFGLNNGLVPIVAYNYGARREQRIVGTMKYAFCYATAIMAVGTLIFQLFPGWLFSLFNASDAMIAIGVPALRIISLSFLLAGVAIVFSGMFQALGNGMLSLMMSLTRQMAVILPIAWLMARFVGLNAVWAAFPIAELSSITMALMMYRYVYRKEIQPLSAPAGEGSAK